MKSLERIAMLTMKDDPEDLKVLAAAVVQNANRLAQVVFPYDEAGKRILRIRLRETAVELGRMADAFEEMASQQIQVPTEGLV